MLFEIQSESVAMHPGILRITVDPEGLLQRAGTLAYSTRYTHELCHR
jgi:hypothetical protein